MSKKKKIVPDFTQISCAESIRPKDGRFQVSSKSETIFSFT